MKCKHYMLSAPTTVLDTAPLSEALSIMIRKHMQDLMVVMWTIGSELEFRDHLPQYSCSPDAPTQLLGHPPRAPKASDRRGCSIIASFRICTARGWTFPRPVGWSSRKRHSWRAEARFDALEPAGGGGGPYSPGDPGFLALSARRRRPAVLVDHSPTVPDVNRRATGDVSPAPPPPPTPPVCRTTQGRHWWVTERLPHAPRRHRPTSTIYVPLAICA